MSFMRRTDQAKDYDQRSMSENMRDLDDAIRRGARVRVSLFEGFYTEPMWIGDLRSSPVAILLGRIQAVNSPEEPVANVASLVHFVWDDTQQGARITKISGLTAGTSTQYRFVFLLVYVGGA